MTNVEINWMMIFLVITAVSLVTYIVVKYLWRFWFWFVPIVTVLLFGLLYSIVFLADVADGSLSNPLIFNAYNQIMRGSFYTVIIAYAVVFIAVQRKFRGHDNG